MVYVQNMALEVRGSHGAVRVRLIPDPEEAIPEGHRGGIGGSLWP
jgi:hypothetical protein